MKDFILDALVILVILFLATIGGAAFGLLVTGNLHF